MLSALAQELWTFSYFGGHISGHLVSHLGFIHLDMPGVILMHLVKKTFHIWGFLAQSGRVVAIA